MGGEALGTPPHLVEKSRTLLNPLEQAKNMFRAWDCLVFLPRMVSADTWPLTKAIARERPMNETTQNFAWWLKWIDAAQEVPRGKRQNLQVWLAEISVGFPAMFLQTTPKS